MGFLPKLVRIQLEGI